MTRTLRGTCHCGDLSFDLMTSHPVEELEVRECPCSFCRLHGARWIADPNGHAVVRLNAADRVSRYRFGHRTSDFLICRQCGALLVSVCAIDDQLYGVFNARSIPFVAFSRKPIVMDFDGESPRERLSRRRKCWVGMVSIELGQERRDFG